MNLLLQVVVMLIIFVQYGSCVIGNDDVWTEETKDLQACICVPYWQCKDDNSGVDTIGEDLMDIRMARSKKDAHCIEEFDICCKIRCGQRKMAVFDEEDEDEMNRMRMRPRIMGNDEAEFGEFPWMLGILRGDIYKCGASLIHPQVAVTAAHCVFASGTYKVRAGEWNWLSTKERLPYQERKTKKIIIHSDFKTDNLQNDIALLILESPFIMAENVGIVCLPPTGISYSASKCTVSGWGKNTYFQGKYQPTLKKINLPIVSRNACLRLLRNTGWVNPFFNLHKSFICAGGGRERDTCKGDGGSPLFCKVEGEHNVYEQIGIVSWGFRCGKFNTPGMYVNVPMFNEWIDKNMLANNFDTSIYRY